MSQKLTVYKTGFAKLIHIFTNPATLIRNILFMAFYSSFGTAV
jgi:hypothetical protein